MNNPEVYAAGGGKLGLSIPEIKEIRNEEVLVIASIALGALFAFNWWQSKNART